MARIYRGFTIDAVPGMCCPRVRIRENDRTLHSFPHNDPHGDGMRIAERYVDTFVVVWAEERKGEEAEVDCWRAI